MHAGKVQTVWEELGRGLAAPLMLYGFVAAWAYCAWTYGFLLGFGLGWLPAGILAGLAGSVAYHLWPDTLTLFGFALLYGVTAAGSILFGW